MVFAAILGFTQTQGLERVLLILATGLYLFGVQLPTITINIPLNNNLRFLDFTKLDETALIEARRAFEARWNRSNRFRTVLASLVAALFMLLLFLQ